MKAIYVSLQMRKQLFLILLLFFPILGKSQTDNVRTISGYITDLSSGEQIYGARIFDTVSRKGTVTNDYGYFSLTIPDNDAVLRISNFGFTSRYASAPKGMDELDVSLESKVQNIQEVKVTAESQRKSTEETNSGTLELSLKQVERLPVFMGEKDVIKTLQLMPGVSSGGEGSSGLYVRGGGPDQNLILLDGVPIYNASHLFGFFSVFNNDALSKVTMIKGGFPSRYGGRTSSVLDMRMKEGNLKKFNVEGSIGVISSKILVEGPIKKDKTAFIISARRTYADLLIRPFLAKRPTQGGYFFYDVNAKIHHKFNRKHHLYVSTYFGEDKAKIKEKSTYTDPMFGTKYENSAENSLGWGNSIGSVRWNYRIRPKLFMNTTATFSQYKFGIRAYELSTTTQPTGDVSSSEFEVNYFSNIQDWSGKVDFTYIPNSKNYIKFGVGDTYHTFRPGVFSAKFTDGNDTESLNPPALNQYAHETSAYIENDQKLTDWLKINYGLHFSSFFVGDKNYNELQPRLSGNAVVSKNSSIKFSYARTAQFIHLLSNTGIGLPTDLWVPATERIGPIQAHQVSWGYNHLSGKNYNLVIEGYYKTMKNLIQYKEGVSFIGSSADWQSKVEVGKGWSYGGEIFVEKKAGALTGWIGYTLSWTERQFDNINGGEKFPFTYDRRHDLSIAATYELSKKWDFGVVFVFSSGRAVSLTTQSYSLAQNPIVSAVEWSQNGGDVNYLSSINGYRMPVYHRLDIGANRHMQRKWGESIWSFSIYNVYSRQNPFFLFVDQDFQGEKSLKQVALFPIIPSVSWKFKFTHLGEKKDKK
jgi:hypothetical protein